MLFSWRLGLAVIALAVLLAVVHGVLAIGPVWRFVLATPIGFWLGVLAGLADIEERKEALLDSDH